MACRLRHNGPFRWTPQLGTVNDRVQFFLGAIDALSPLSGQPVLCLERVNQQSQHIHYSRVHVS
jgi:hypothetical protein